MRSVPLLAPAWFAGKDFLFLVENEARGTRGDKRRAMRQVSSLAMFSSLALVFPRRPFSPAFIDRRYFNTLYKPARGPRAANALFLYIR